MKEFAHGRRMWAGLRLARAPPMAGSPWSRFQTAGDDCQCCWELMSKTFNATAPFMWGTCYELCILFRQVFVTRDYWGGGYLEFPSLLSFCQTYEPTNTTHSVPFLAPILHPAFKGKFCTYLNRRRAGGLCFSCRAGGGGAVRESPPSNSAPGTRSDTR